MTTLAWIAVWTVVLATLAVLVIRERRSGKKPVDFDADAPRGAADGQARIDAQMRGPNVRGQIGL